MKSLWRKIGYIMAWGILVLGTVGAIVSAATGYGGFPGFCSHFVPALFEFTILMVYLEHTNNIEMRTDQTYRKQNNLPQLPESSYTNLPISSSPAPQYQQPMQFQQPAPQYQQPAPQIQQPAPQYQQPAPQIQQPAPQAAQPWTCPNCGTQNNPNASFCKGCGNKKG